MSRFGKCVAFVTLFILLATRQLCAAVDTTNANGAVALSLSDLYNLKVTVASKKAEKIADAPGVISVVTADDLKRFGGTTLGDVLKRVPGLLGSTTFFSERSAISVRGDQVEPSSSHVLLLINGRPVREIMEGGLKSEVYESFPVNVIDHIEVIRGPGSVLYGSQAFSGVINIVTKNPETNTVAVSAALGEGFAKNVTANLQYTIGDIGLVVAGRYGDKGTWNTSYIANADVKGVTSGVVDSMHVSIPDYGPGAYAEINYKDVRLMGSYNEWTNHCFIPDAEFLYAIGAMPYHAASAVTWKKAFGDLGYKHAFSGWYNMAVNATCTYSNIKTEGYPLTLRNSYEAMGEWTNFFIPFNDFNVVLGGTYALQNGEEVNALHDTNNWNRGVNTKGHTGNIFTGYAQTDYRLEWCKFIGGLQINKVFYLDSTGKRDDFSADYNPRAGVIFYPIEHVNVKALYSTAYRAPSMNELYLNYRTLAGKMVPRNDDSLYAVSSHDLNLKPEKVNTYDLGATYQSEKIQIGINGFYSRITNLIRLIPYSSYLTIYDNFGNITVAGIECEGQCCFFKNMLIEGSLLYQKSKNVITGEKNVTPLPDFSAKLGLSYETKFGLLISVFNTFEQSVDPKYYDTLNPSTKAFNMANVHCIYDLKKLIHVSTTKELSLVLAIDNLAGEKIWLPAWQQVNGQMIPYDKGRRIYVGFRAAF